MIHTINLSQLIFDRPAPDASELIIISGWVGPPQVELALQLNVRLTILFGMAPTGIKEPTHLSFTRLDNSNNNLQIYYSLRRHLVHSKCYIWRSNDRTIRALVGSANFTNAGLNVPHKEILVDLDNIAFDDLDAYIRLILSDVRTERCTSPVLQTSINTITRAEPSTTRIVPTNPADIILTREADGVKSIRLTLLDRTGNVHSQAGLNWGFSSGHVRPNDAYIRISKAAIRTGFFKAKEADREPIDAVWDDGIAMELFEEGNQTDHGILYPKQISSARSKDILGKYLRRRLGVGLGERITNEHLVNYGRTHIDITELEPGNYYLDFSRP